MDTTGRVISEARRNGVNTLLRKGASHTYAEFIRPRLPPVAHPVLYNEIIVDFRRWFDDYIPRSTLKRANAVNEPNFKCHNADFIREYTTRGDSFVNVGAGVGVTPTIGARSVGVDGTVTSYEGSWLNTIRTRRTFRLNGVEDRSTVEFASVGRKKHIPYEEVREDNRRHVSGDELPECDVLELDCEGAEQEILQSLSGQPRHIIVETHPPLNSPTDEVRSILNHIGYAVVDEYQYTESDSNTGAVLVGSRTD